MTLRPVEFHILLALAAEERHGYGLLQEVSSLTGGELQLEPGTLYRALHRMLKDGWVVESARRPAADVDDERRRYYRITPAGRRAASVEASRLARLVALARAHKLLSHGGPAQACGVRLQPHLGFAAARLVAGARVPAAVPPGPR